MVNLPRCCAAFAAFASTPLPSTQTLTGHRSKVPAAVISTVLPRCPPDGNMESSVGGAEWATGAEISNANKTSDRVAVVMLSKGLTQSRKGAEEDTRERPCVFLCAFAALR